MKPRFPKFGSLFLLSVLAVSASAFAQDGGASSGGGNDLGIFALREFGVVADSLDQIDSLYTPEQKARMKSRAKSIRSVLVVEEDLPVSNDGHSHGTHFIQNGTAWSRFDGEKSEVRLNAKKFSEMADPVAIDGLLHHELAILAGIEKTGEYGYTDRYLDFREKEWKSKKMICVASVFEKKAGLDGSPNPGKMLGSASTPAISFSETAGGVLYLENLDRSRDPYREASRSRVLRYVSSGGGYFRAVLSEVDSRRTESVPLDGVTGGAGVLFSGPLSDRTSEITYYNVYDWMSSSREARLRDFGGGYLMVSCARL